MGRRLASKQKYQAETPTTLLHEGKVIAVKTGVRPKTPGQKFYLDTLEESVITLATGPAGCGKSWLAAYYATTLLLENKIERIIVTKPIIEAGEEELGALPGELEDKVLPYFRSILDCFEDHLGSKMLNVLLERKKIEFIPTAYCRGRDFKHAFIFIDEAQNLTKAGIKLLMTRLGEDSKMLLNGDADQIDLPNKEKSGFQWAINQLRGRSADIGVVELSSEDNQRHPLLKTVISALY